MTTSTSRAIPHVTVGITLAVTTAGPFLFDAVIPAVANQHLHNPAWPPHAKFHDAQYTVMSALLGAIGLVVLLCGPRTPQRLRLAAAIAAVPWLGMFGATLFPQTAAQDPEFADSTPRIIGLHPQLFIALVLLLTLGAALALAVRQSTPGARTAISTRPN